jgi:phosphatidylinositol alpha-1,6-mannosyltransferase
VTRRLLWVSLPDQRPRRELWWLSQVPGTHVTALAATPPDGDVEWHPSRYVRPVRRFVEAGALAWIRGLAAMAPNYDWVASLELCSLVTGQAAVYKRRHGLRQAVITWENLTHQPLYHLPPYREAFRRSLDADLFICPVVAARQHLLEHGVDDERISVVAPGVDASTFHPAESPVTEPVAVFTSPLAANKGIDTVLHAFAVARRSVPEARLLVMGAGPMESMVRRAAADSRSGIELVPPGDAEAVAETLRRGSVFVTAPRSTWKWNEQFGLAYLEAMATGLPIVTTVCGTNGEAVRAPNVRTANNPEALGAALTRFLVDESLRRTVGAHNRTRALREHDLTRSCTAIGAAFARHEP